MRRGRAILLVVATVSAAMVLCSGCGTSGQRDGMSVSAADTAAVIQAVGTPVVGSVRSAAMDAVGLTGQVMSAGFISRRDLIGSFTTPSFGPTLADETSEQVTALLFELGDRGAPPGDLMVMEQPVTATVLTDTGRTATVAVWSVLVVAAPGAGPARQVWRTVTLDMVRDGQRWLVDGWVSAIGPTPALAPEVDVSDAAAVAAVLGWTDGGAG